MGAFIPDQLGQMSKKELLEFAQTAHEENVSLSREVVTVKRTYNELFDEMLKEQERNRELRQQLANANERVKELEQVRAEYSFLIADLVRRADIKNDLYMNPTYKKASEQLNQFAVEQQIKGIDDAIKNAPSRLKYRLPLIETTDLYDYQEQLRKEQE